jgi:hypothetical protein
MPCCVRALVVFRAPHDDLPIEVPRTLLDLLDTRNGFREPNRIGIELHERVTICAGSERCKAT